jgi:hypothetical protein
MLPFVLTLLTVVDPMDIDSVGESIRITFIVPTFWLLALSVTATVIMFAPSELTDVVFYNIFERQV